MRFDSFGMFWQDAERVLKRSGGSVSRPMPPIPETGWRPPVAYPNLASAPVLSVDVETYDPSLTEEKGPGWGRGTGHICGFSVAAPGGYKWYFPIRHTVEPEYNLNPDQALAWLRDTMALMCPKVGANLIYDVGWLNQEGIAVNGDLVDVQFAEALLDERAHVGLEFLGQKYLGEGKQSSLLQKWIMDYYAPSKDKWRSDIYRSPPRLVGPYGEADADLPLRVAPILYQRLQAEGLLDLFRMECDLIRLLIAMRFEGVSVSTSRAEELREVLIQEARTHQDGLDSLAGFKVNVNSADDLKKLFDRAALGYGVTETGKASFRKELLEKLDHPIAKAVVDIRKLEKFRATFVEGYILDANVKGKIYCSFHPLRGDDGGTRSGRFSSSDPNLQNIPIRDERLGPLLRSVFIPDEGHRQWRKYDYSQIEYRFLIHYAVGPGSDEARALFCRNPDTDYHDMTQRLVKEQTGQDIPRRPIKNLNFGIIFGMGEAKLARSLNLGPKEAKHFMEQYHKGVPFAKPTMKATMDEANQTGLITTILGRRSRFDLWEPANYGDGDAPDRVAVPYSEAILRYGRIRRAYIHKALNRRLQGSAADLMKVAMWRCWRDGVFAATGVPRLTVHDELDFSDPGGRDEAFAEMLRIMETAIPLRLPVRADCDIGPDWGRVEPVS